MITGFERPRPGSLESALAELNGIRLIYPRAHGWVLEEVSVSGALVQAGLEPAIRAVIAGDRARIPEPDPPVSGPERESILRAYLERLPASGIHFGRGSPEGWSSLHHDELQRRMDKEILPRADGARWHGATLRAVVAQAGLPPWVPRSP